MKLVCRVFVISFALMHEPGGSPVLNKRYKVRDMMFDGKLEY